MVHNLGGIGLVEAGSQVGLSGSQTDGIANALAQRAGCHLHSVGHEVLGVTRGRGVELTEALQVIHL